MCMGVLHVCKSVHHMCAWYPQKWVGSFETDKVVGYLVGAKTQT